MPWTTPETFTAGQTLTAASMNAISGNLDYLPRGVIGINTAVTSSFTTSATHTTMQDITGMSCSATYGANRYLRVTISIGPYASGGFQAIQYRLLRGSTTIHNFDFPSEAMAVGVAFGVTRTIVIEGPSTGATETFKVQMRAISNNTAVSNYAAGVFPGRIIVEDVGSSA